MPLHHLPSSGENFAQSPLVELAVGAALLLAGRKLFWLFVAAVGFLGALRLASEYLSTQPREWILIGSLIAGAVGAMLALFLQKVAIGVGGAVAGAYLLDMFFRSSLPEYPAHGWIFLAGAAVVGAILMAVVFRWALILLSSMAGAQLIAQLLPLRRDGTTIAFAVLALIGILVQGRRKGSPST